MNVINANLICCFSETLPFFKFSLSVSFWLIIMGFSTINSLCPLNTVYKDPYTSLPVSKQTN